MKIENKADLEAVLKMLRKHGVDEASIDGCTFKLGSAPVRPVKDTDEKISTQGMSDEQLMFWSAQQHG